MFDFGVSKQALQKVLGLISQAVGLTDSQVIQNKTVIAQDNVIKQTTPALGSILKDDGIKFSPLARGAAGKPFRSNDAGTDTEFNTLGVPGGGTGQVTLSTGTVLIGAGTSGITTKTNPAGSFLGDSDVQNITGLKTFSSSTLGRRNPAGTFTLTEINAAVGSNLSDTPAYLALAQTIMNKILDSTNTISSATSLPTVTIAKGGTGATTAAAGYDALSSMTTLGDVQYGGAAGTRTRLAGNITATKKFLRQTGNGTISAAPTWDTLVDGDIPTTLANHTITNPLFDNYHDYTKVSAPANPAAEVGRVYFKQVDANNNSLAVKEKVGGAIIEVLYS